MRTSRTKSGAGGLAAKVGRAVGASLVMKVVVNGIAGEINSAAASPPSNCVDGRANYYFNGYYKSAANQGAQAYITEDAPITCTGGVAAPPDEMLSSAWVMMDNRGDPAELAQAGWLKLTGFGSADKNTVYWFIEYGHSNQSLPPILVNAISNPGSHAPDKYTVYTDGNGVTQFIIDNTGVWHDTLDWTANDDFWAGETHDKNDQQPGETASQVYYSQVQTLANGVWYNQDPSLGLPFDSNNDPCSNCAHTPGAVNNWWIWDTRY